MLVLSVNCSRCYKQVSTQGDIRELSPEATLAAASSLITVMNTHRCKPDDEGSEKDPDAGSFD